MLQNICLAARVQNSPRNFNFLLLSQAVALSKQSDLYNYCIVFEDKFLLFNQIRDMAL